MLKVQPTSTVKYLKTAQQKYSQNHIEQKKPCTNTYEQASKLAQTVALIQNAINEQEKILNPLYEKHTQMMIKGADWNEINKSLMYITEIKTKIKTYKDCSELILQMMN